MACGIQEHNEARRKEEFLSRRMQTKEQSGYEDLAYRGACKCGCGKMEPIRSASYDHQIRHALSECPHGLCPGHSSDQCDKRLDRWVDRARMSMVNMGGSQYLSMCPHSNCPHHNEAKCKYFSSSKTAAANGAVGSSLGGGGGGGVCRCADRRYVPDWEKRPIRDSIDRELRNKLRQDSETTYFSARVPNRFGNQEYFQQW